MDSAIADAGNGAGQTYKWAPERTGCAARRGGTDMAEECADCGASFGSASDLMVHMRTAHSGGDAAASLSMNPESHRAGLVCGLCGERFRTRAALARHNELPHPPQRISSATPMATA
jgi:Zinc finger, C2H2 type